MSATPAIAPLHITGNTTPVQLNLLKELLGEAVVEAAMTALSKLDRQSAQVVLDTRKTLKGELSRTVVETIERFTISNLYDDEVTQSDRSYPATYRVRPIEAQVTALRKFFPQLGGCMEKVARRPLPEGAECWIAVPRWQAMAPTYYQATEMVLAALGTQRKFSNRLAGKLNETYLRQTERAMRAREILDEQQPGNDILVVAAQAGMLHRGVSARRARVSMRGNEFGLGALSLGSFLLTHPERLSSHDALMIDCCGDEYSLRGDCSFDRVPLYDYDLGGMQFSVFHEDRARNIWGSPSGFLFQMP